jgi:hypothetical protein
MSLLRSTFSGMIRSANVGVTVTAGVAAGWRDGVHPLAPLPGNGLATRPSTLVGFPPPPTKVQRSQGLRVIGGLGAFGAATGCPPFPQCRAGVPQLPPRSCGPNGGDPPRRRDHGGAQRLLGLIAPRLDPPSSVAEVARRCADRRCPPPKSGPLTSPDVHHRSTGGGALRWALRRARRGRSACR